MSVSFQHIKNFQEFRGVDLKSSDIERPSVYASGGKNSSHTERNGLVKRYGYQYKLHSVGGSGAYTYTKINATTGAEEPEVLLISDKVYKVVISSFTITYSGPATSDVLFTSFYSVADASFVAQIIEDGVVKLNSQLGIGFDAASVKTLTQFAAEVNAIPNYNMVITGLGSAPAAFMEITRGKSFTPAAPLVMEFMYEVELNKTVTTPLPGSVSNRSSANFENAAAVNRNGVIYIVNGYDDNLKYDGQTLYKMGLPNPETAIVASLTTGGITDSDIVWSYNYVQVDAAGQEYQSDMSLDSNVLQLTADGASLVVPNIQAGSGFNTNCAIVNGGAAVAVNIPVDNGAGGNHTLQLGDTAYFFDGVTNTYVARLITARSNTQITIAGAPVTVLDNAVISNNLRIPIWRNTASGFNKYLVAEIPNNSFAATQVYVDNVAIADLGAEYLEPIYPPALVPKCKYITVFKNMLILTGNPEAPNTVYFTDIDGIEGSPAATHSFDYFATNGQVNSGVGGSNDQLCIFKKNAITAVSGDLANLNFQLSPLTSGDIGCVAHASIQEIREGVLFFLSDRGPYMVQGGQGPQPVGPAPTQTGQATSRIEPYFTKKRMDKNEIPKLKRAVAINYSHLNLYILFVPVEDVNSAGAANNTSAVWAYDYSRDAWLPQWDTMNMAGGMAVLNNRLFWAERVFSTFSSTVTSKVAMQLRTVDPYDFADHNLPINWEYAFHWENLGDPSIFKKFLRAMIFALEIVENDSYTLGIRTEANYTEGLISTDSQMKFGEDESFGYGISEYGDAPYGDPVDQSKKIKLKSDHMKSMRLLLSNSEMHRNVIVTGYELECAAPFKDMKE